MVMILLIVYRFTLIRVGIPSIRESKQWFNIIVHPKLRLNQWWKYYLLIRNVVFYIASIPLVVYFCWQEVSVLVESFPFVIFLYSLIIDLLSTVSRFLINKLWCETQEAMYCLQIDQDLKHRPTCKLNTNE